MKLGFLILAHDNPANTARLVKLLLASGSAVCLHYDLNAGDAPLKEIKDRLGALADQIILPKRVRVSWGEWSIVEATLHGLRALLESGHELDYIHLMSGADYPIRPVSEFRAFLERHNGVDFIESHPVAKRQWVKDGLSRERFQYRHFFNFKAHPKLFSWCWKVQAALKLRRKPPEGLSIHMGSQWWTLTTATCRHVLERGTSREIVRFFRRSWIPDEMFVQTLAAEMQRKHSNRHLTLYQFNDYGVPIIYYDSHAAYLSTQPFFFARKLSPYAHELRDALDIIVGGERQACRFVDSEIGSPTAEYGKFKTLHRYGLPGRRLPGRIESQSRGELTWNNRRYLVILGSSTFELEQVADVLRRIPDIVCHGFLFAWHEVDFAGGVGALAGYSRSGIALRDHSPSTFLADVVNSNPDKLTCFLLRRQEAPQFLNDTLRMDPNASIVLVEGGIIRDYMDRHGHYATDPGRTGQARLHAEAARIVAFQRETTGWIDDLHCGPAAPTLPHAVVRPDRVPVLAAFYRVDVLDPQWRRQLIDAVLAVGVSVNNVASLTSIPDHETLRPRRIDIQLWRALWPLSQDGLQKSRMLSEVLAPEKNPYLAVVTPDRRAAVRIGYLLSLSGCLSCPETQPVTVPELLVDLIQYGLSRKHRPAIFAFGADDISLTECVLRDPDARVLAVRLSIDRQDIVASASGRYLSLTLEAEQSRAWSHFEERLKSSAAPVAILNGHGNAWIRDASNFISAGFPVLDGYAPQIEAALGEVEGAGHGREGHA